ncbi:MAG: hypothetical protein AB7Q17_16460 [Phycisphaerae bacterium]
MSLAELQTALARVYTVATDREMLRRDAAGAARALAVPVETVAVLARMDGARIESFAQSLIHKRRGDVWKLLPLTARVLGGEGARRFARYALREPRAVQASIRDAALGFVRFLRQCAAPRGAPTWPSEPAASSIASDARPSAAAPSLGAEASDRSRRASAARADTLVNADALPGWIVELARYESARLELCGCRRRWIIRWYRHRPQALIVRAARGGRESGAAPPTHPTIQLYWRRRGEIRTITLAWPRGWGRRSARN